MAWEELLKPEWKKKGSATTYIGVILILAIIGILGFFYLTQKPIKETAEKIVPCLPEALPCMLVDIPMSSSITSISGFRTYKMSELDIYVLSPGNDGKITYKIYRGSPRSGQSELGYFGQNLTNRNLTNYAGFCHEENITIEQNVTYKEFLFPNSDSITLPNNYTRIRLEGGNKIIFPNGTTIELTEETTIDLPPGTIVPGFKACYSLPEERPGEQCLSGPGPPPPKIITITVKPNTHPGVNVYFQPESEILGFNSSVTVTLFISADSDAPEGSYLISLTPGPCEGGLEFILTIGNTPYAGKI